MHGRQGRCDFFKSSIPLFCEPKVANIDGQSTSICFGELFQSNHEIQMLLLFSCRKMQAGAKALSVVVCFVDAGCFFFF